MVYRNNTGRLGFWLHQCVLRNTLAGSKTVVSISRNHPVYFLACTSWRIFLGVYEFHAFISCIAHPYVRQNMKEWYAWGAFRACVTWLIHMWDTTHANVQHDLFMCGVTHSYVWHDSISFIRVTWLDFIHTCDMTRSHSYVWHDSISLTLCSLAPLPVLYRAGIVSFIGLFCKSHVVL